MAGNPPKPPPRSFAAGSSAPKPPPPAFDIDDHDSHEKLVDSYLRPRVVSGTKVDFIHEADLYSAHPAQLTHNYRPVIARDGERAWYFFTKLRPSPTAKGSKRTVDTGAGREGTWRNYGGVTNIPVSRGKREIGRRRLFHFKGKADGKSVPPTWSLWEYSLDPKEGGQGEHSPNLLVLSKVFRNPDAKADEDDESSTAVGKADGETSGSAASGVATPGPGRKGAGEEIGAETAAGSARMRKAGDKDSAAETVALWPGLQAALWPGLQKKADGESAGAAATGGNLADSTDPHDAAEKAEQEEPRARWGSRVNDLFLQEPNKR